jgi:hypothetical protein
MISPSDTVLIVRERRPSIRARRRPDDQHGSGVLIIRGQPASPTITSSNGVLIIRGRPA